ncbi:MAG: 2-oxo acid dehydrogenase subunit E2 [Verrucomicrobiae bacterium]|nr:2-oxo acid dehydrogenase subunit E2 [Verrucomicrobiae bacterium]
MPRVPIYMPQLGESIAEATIREIGIAAGDDVKADQEIFQVETDKAMMGVTTPASGAVLEVVAALDESYAVGATLAYLEVTEEEIQRAGLSKTGETGPVQPMPDAPSQGPSETDADPRDESETAGVHFAVNEQDMIAGGPDERPEVKPTIEGLPVPASATGATYLSPRMKARMEELGLNAADLAGVAGSGAGGRVTIEDFEKFIREIEKNKTTEASPMRIAVADSMRRSWSRPLATVGVPVVLDEVIAHRRQQDPKPGIALYAIRALAVALAENTAIAGRLVGERIVHPAAIDIGFAVEVDDGVLVPVMRAVDGKKLGELVESYDQLVQKARKRKLPPEARGAGIATVTNFGTFGIVWATPIPLPEQNLVLGLGAGTKVPHWDPETESFFPKTEAQLTLSFDHRILDGGAAGRLLQRIGDLLQKPETL